MIPFNLPSITEKETEYALQVLRSGNICGDKFFTKRVHEWMQARFHAEHPLLVTSGTHALELAAMLLDLQPGDEVIAPSYTFVSTINAFMLRGAKPVFADIDPNTMNIDPINIEKAITPKTKAVFPVHYAGVSCDMESIMDLAEEHGISVVEDAAQAVGSAYKGKLLGTIGDFGCYSFHETKNYVSGEGGMLCVNREKFFKQAEIIREKGTDRSQFIRGQVDKYTWQGIGSSYVASDLLAALLFAQLERFEEIMEKRLRVWNLYHAGFDALEREGKLRRPVVPDYASHNAHMYYLILPDKVIRDSLIESLKEKGVQSVFHYIPLHSSPMGLKLGYKPSDLPLTEEYASRLLRLPMYADLSLADAEYVVESVASIL